MKLSNFIMSRKISVTSTSLKPRQQSHVSNLLIISAPRLAVSPAECIPLVLFLVVIAFW